MPSANPIVLALMAMASSLSAGVAPDNVCTCDIPIQQEIILPETEQYIVYTDSVVHPVEDIINIPVTILSTEYGYFNTMDMIFTYDPDILQLKTVELKDNYLLVDEPGVVRVMRYGSNMSIGSGFSLQFSLLKKKNTEIIVDTACIDNAENAVYQDVMKAVVLSDVIKVCCG